MPLPTSTSTKRSKSASWPVEEARRLTGNDDADGPRALLVGCRVRSEDRDIVAESLTELARLVDTAGAIEVGCVKCEVKRPVPATFVGRGAIDRIAKQLAELDVPVRCVVFDVDLTATQQRNLESRLEVMVIDRTGIILDIFAKRAQTREGKLQVELAQYQYLLPRLRGLWTHLSRQGAGIGTRGPGETDLEIDRRRIRQRIAGLKKKLEKVRMTRELHRSERRKSQVQTVALVGYTNAGKSTLLNACTDADVLIEDRLFATLDPTAREIALPGNVKAVMVDTVGFIQRLPHQLVESFKATLEEVTLADLIVHVVDASHPRMEQQVGAVAEVLHEIGATDQAMVYVFNKADLVIQKPWLDRLVAAHQPAVAVSARDGSNLDDFRNQLALTLGRHRRRAVFRVPLARPDVLHILRTRAEVIADDIDGQHVVLTLRIGERLAGRWREFRIEENGS